MKKNKIAFIGGKLNHSLLPMVYQVLSRHLESHVQLEPFLVKNRLECEVIEHLDKQSYLGACITLPHKMRMFEIAEQVTERAKIAGSVNVLRFSIALNSSKSTMERCLSDITDGVGFIDSMKKLEQTSFTQKRILLLGAGGVAHSILPLLIDEDPSSICVYNRTLEKAQKMLSKFQQQQMTYMSLEQLSGLSEPFDIIINCTSASVYQKQLFLPDNLVGKNTFCVDCAYLANELTLFEQWALTNNAKRVVNGIGMLVMQAVHAVDFYINHRLSEQVVVDIVKQLRQQFWRGYYDR